MEADWDVSPGTRWLTSILYGPGSSDSTNQIRMLDTTEETGNRTELFPNPCERSEPHLEQ